MSIMEFIATDTFSSVTDSDRAVSTFTLATGDVLVAIVENITTATDDALIGFRLATDGVPNYDAGTAYLYQTTTSVNGSIVPVGGATSGMWATNGSSSEQLGSAAGESMSGIYYFYGLQDSRFTRMEGRATYEYPAGTNANGVMAAQHSTASAVTHIRFRNNDGNMSGSVHWSVLRASEIA